MFKNIPKTVWALGFVSLFMDISSEMIHSLLPMYLVTVLNVSALSVGIIEGVAEATALMVKTFSGVLSDWLGKRKVLAFIGYLLGALTKPVFAIATGQVTVFLARFIDRIGKGIRGAPRDALVADITPQHLLGAAYGLRQSLDTIGAFLGPLIAIMLMMATQNDFKSVFWFAVLPGFLSVAILMFAVDESPNTSTRLLRQPIQFHEIKKLKLGYWMVVLTGSLFSLARFSEAFLLLKAKSVGIPVSFIPGMLILMNIVYSLTAYPAGYLSDKIGRKGLIATGFLALIASDIAFMISDTGWQVALGTCIWGLHMGLTQGLLSTMIADTADPDLRGTSFGVFSMASSIAMLAASIIAGWSWDTFGPFVTFLLSAIFATASLFVYLALTRLD
ncbi:MAG: MFS transporter [Desulfobacterales bacterium]|nr:MFS transporter [Desulfobacterales bacterium]